MKVIQRHKSNRKKKSTGERKQTLNRQNKDDVAGKSHRKIITNPKILMPDENIDTVINKDVTDRNVSQISA